MTDALEQVRAALSGRYAVERELGRGGMATVYLATDLKHGRRVAIKVLREEFAAAIGHERFLREIQTTAMLVNPHILPLLDSGESGSVVYYVMPYIEGESLQDRLSRQAQLSIEDTVAIASDVAAALSYAHSQGVIHRDIKPANIMLSSGEAIVMDFGIARALTKDGDEHLTSTGLTVGTPAYMSPEQSTGGVNLDARTDIYSLGTVVYEMLAGEPPFTGPNPQSVIAKRLTDEVPRIRVVRDIPEPLELAVRKSLARAPADRWATVSEFAAALRGERTTQGFAAMPPRAPRTKQLVAGGIALAALAAAVLLVVPLIDDRRTATTNVGVTAPPPGMVLVPGGTYHVFGGGCATCVPAQTVTLDSFFIDRTEVTVAQYRAHAAAARVPVPSTAAPDSLFPITGVMWPEADAYCRARDALSQLPTEQQWEAAARGPDGLRYAWGNTWDAARANAAGNERARLMPVGSFAGGASRAGAMDMIGNAWEWTSSPAPPRDGRRQFVFRGGAFDTPDSIATTYFRAWQPEAVAEKDRRNYDKTGFRCARALR